MHTAKYLTKIILYFHTTKIQKYVLACIFGFNNWFIKATRTRPIFQKFQKKLLFCLLLISRITDLYVRRILDIQMVVCFH